VGVWWLYRAAEVASVVVAAAADGAGDVALVLLYAVGGWGFWKRSFGDVRL